MLQAKIFGGAPPPGERSPRGGGSGRAEPSLPAPTLDSAGARPDELPISWRSDDTSGNLGYELRWRPHGRSPPAQWESEDVGSAASFRRSVKGLQPNTAYALCVRGNPTAGGAPRDGTELLASTLPAQPTGVQVVGRGWDSLRLRWRSSGAARYAVYGSAALGFAKVYSGSECECTVDGLEEGKDYGFRVCAMNTMGGTSPFSEEISARCGTGREEDDATGGDDGSDGVVDDASDADSHADGPLAPRLLTLTADALSMNWAGPPGGALMYPP
jgi:hypothetical protein